MLVACGRTTTHYESFVAVEHRQIVDEILVVKNIRRRSHQLEPDSLITLVAWRKKVAPVHYHLM